MKITLVCGLLLLLAASSLLAQTDAGMRTLGRTSSGETRAVIVGISKYGEGIRSLQFAHRDAEAYAGFLRSKAGGEVPVENIRILLNEQATLAAIDDALFWLRTTSQKGDKAVFYFSGHGDVETDAHWEFGYLLCSDSPPNNFRNNAVRVEDLDLLAIELSTVREARTLFIIDACRSGTLADGRQVPHTHLANQRANEVRILSCRADQVSIEGTQWGGGRGVFSWHLLRGLQGLAKDADLGDDPDLVTLEELDLYLRRNLRRATQNLIPPQYQDPVVSGPERFQMANVDPDILASVKAADMLDEDLSGAIASRGGDEGEHSFDAAPAFSKVHGLFKQLGHSKLLDHLDLRPLLELTPREVPPAFLQLIDETKNRLPFNERQFLEGIQSDEILPGEDDQDVLRFNLRLAVLLHDYGQELINRYLRTDQSDIVERTFQKDRVMAYVRHPAIFGLALSILPEDHPLVPRLRVKHLYYEGLARRILAVQAQDFEGEVQAALALQQQALALDDKAPYIHNELGILYKWLDRNKQAESHFQKAIELAPSWGLPYSNLAGLYIQEQRWKEAWTMADRGLERAPQYFGVHMHLGRLYWEKGDLISAEDAYLRAHRLNESHFLPHRELGLLYLHTHDFEKAEAQLIEFSEKSRGVVHFVPDMFGDGIVDFFHREPAWPMLGPVLSDDPKEIYQYALALIKHSDLEEAEVQLLRIVKLDSDFPLLWDQLAWLYYRQQRYVEADHTMQIALKKEWVSPTKLMLHAEILEHWGRPDAAIAALHQAVTFSPEDPALQKRLGKLCEKSGRPHEAEAAFLRLRQLSPEAGVNALYLLYEGLLRRYPRDQQWMQRMAELLYPYCERIRARPDKSFDTHQDLIFPLHEVWRPQGIVEDYYEKVMTLHPEGLNYEFRTWPGVCIQLDKLANQLVELDSPYRARHFEMRSLVYAKRLMWDEAIADMRLALAYTADSTGVRDRLLTLHRLQPSPLGEMEIMQALFQGQSLRIPDYFRLAEAMIRRGEFIQAESLILQAEEMDLAQNHNYEARVLRALAHWLADDLKMAKTAYQQLATTGMGNQATYVLARMEARQKRNHVALRLLDAALLEGFSYNHVILYDPIFTDVRKDRNWTALLEKHKIQLPE